MADSDVQICNYGLTLLGANRINALDEATKQARECNAIYTLVRDACLAEHEWGFATAMVSLGAPLSDEPLFEYDYQFTLPSDCLRVIKTNLADEEPWERQGNLLLCNSSSVYIKYVKKETSTSVYSPAFTKYLATRLAEELAFPLTGSRTLEADMYARAEKIKNNGYGIDSIESNTNEQPIQNNWRNERY